MIKIIGKSLYEKFVAENVVKWYILYLYFQSNTSKLLVKIFFLIKYKNT